jgi:tetratricopeptide (TPR) repeat protein
MMKNQSQVDEAISLLACLCQWHKFPQIRTKLARSTPNWKDIHSPIQAELSQRKYRRWQHLVTFWQVQGPALLQHAQTRSLIDHSLAGQIAETAGQLGLPQELQLASENASQMQALFIKASSWGVNYGITCPMQLRQLKFQDLFPPMHLSARLADAAILSSAQLALEATQHWLSQKLALQEVLPIWAEISFPDTVKLIDESASLAFVGAVLQRVFEMESPTLAFSGLVRRDSGLIEPVQGFDLPYGKLEAAFDAGLTRIVLPFGTALNALPEAGICLKSLSDTHFIYWLASAPEDSLEIFLVKDLEDLFEACFASADLNRVVRQFKQDSLRLNPPHLGLPGLEHWRQWLSGLLPILPTTLSPVYTALSESVSIAYELTNAGINDRQAWLDCHQQLKTILEQSLLYLMKMITAHVLERAQSQSLLQAFQAASQDLQFQAWLDLLQRTEIQQWLDSMPSTFRSSVRLLNHFCRSVFEQEAAIETDTIWAELRFLIHSLHLPVLFQPDWLVDFEQILSEHLTQSDQAALFSESGSKLHTEQTQDSADPENYAQKLLTQNQPEQALAVYFETGLGFFNKGFTEQAIPFFEKAAAILTTWPVLKMNGSQLFHYLGQSALLTQKKEQAESYFQEELSLARTTQNVGAIVVSLCDIAQVSAPVEAELCLNQARELAEQLAEPDLKVRVYRALGQLISEQRSFQEGQPWFFKALGQSEPQSLAMADTLAAMSYESIRAGQSDMAENDLLTCRQIYSVNQAQAGLASVYHRLGAVCFYQQAYKRAHYYFSEAQTYLSNTGNLKQLTQVKHNLGLLAEALKDYSQAIQIFNDNYDLANQLDDDRIAGLALNQLASLKLKLRDTDAAGRHLFEAERLLIQAKDYRGLAYVKLNFGLLKLLENETQAAEIYLMTARERFNEFQDIMAQDLVTLRLGHCYWLQKKYTEAESLYQVVLQSRKILDAKQKDGLERAYLALGVSKLMQKDLPAAENYLKQAVDILMNTREIPVLAIAVHNQMILAKMQSKFTQAHKIKTDRDMLIGIDRYQITRELSQSEQAFMLFD